MESVISTKLRNFAKNFKYRKYFKYIIGKKIMVIQCAIIFGCLALGELVVWLTGIKLPSSIIGMLILTLLLQTKAVKLRQVEGMANFLVKNFGFFFVPAAVSLMLYFDIIKAQWLPIVVASAVSTVIVIVVTGWIHQLSRKYM